MEDVDIKGKIILKWILKKWDIRMQTGLILLTIQTSNTCIFF